MAEFKLSRAPYGRSLSALHHKGPQALDPEQLASDLRAHADDPLPDELRLWLADYLEGKIKPKRGRPAGDRIERRALHVLRLVAYKRYLDWLQARKKRDGHLDGWSCIRDAGWWQGPPSEKAARMVAERYGAGYHAWRSLQTELSKELP